jgi:hypothetical protein
MVYLFHDLIVSPQKFDRIRASSTRFDVQEVCQSFDIRIMSPLLSSTDDKELGLRGILRIIQEYSMEFRRTIDFEPEELDFKINGLVHKLRDLAHDVLWQSKENQYKHKTQSHETLGAKRVGPVSEQIVMSQFPELNDIFVGAWTTLNSIDQMIKEAIVYTVFIRKEKEDRLFGSKEGMRNLPEFFFTKKMLFVFMDVINRNLNFGFPFSRRYYQELTHFCEMFDRDIFRMLRKRGLRLHRIFDFFMESGYERFWGFHPKEMMMYDRELEMRFHRMGRNTLEKLEKIYSRYKGMY